MMKFAIIAFIFLLVFLAIYLTVTYWIHKARTPTDSKKDLLNEAKCSCDDVKQPPTETK